MRISDWSSDVCSSDLVERPYGSPRRVVAGDPVAEAQAVEGETFGDDGSLGFARPLVPLAQGDQLIVRIVHGHRGHVGALGRSDERRVGKSCVSKFRTLCSPSHSQIKTRIYTSY